MKGGGNASHRAGPFEARAVVRPAQAETVAREHVRQAVTEGSKHVGHSLDWDVSEHLTAALVFAVLSLNDTLRNLEWQRKAMP